MEFPNDSGEAVIKIATEPQGAEIIIDNKGIGRSPLIVTNLSMGKRRLIIKRDGYITKRAVLNLKGDEDEKLNINLSKAYSVKFETAPPGALLTINNREAGETPVTVTQLKTGDYEIGVNLDGYIPVKKEITISEKFPSDTVIAIDIQEGVSKVDTLDEKAGVDKTAASKESAEQDKQDSDSKGDKPGQKEEKDEEKKDKEERIASIMNKISFGAFLGFTLVIFAIEAAQTKD